MFYTWLDAKLLGLSEKKYQIMKMYYRLSMGLLVLGHGGFVERRTLNALRVQQFF